MIRLIIKRGIHIIRNNNMLRKIVQHVFRRKCWKMIIWGLVQKLLVIWVLHSLGISKDIILKVIFHNKLSNHRLKLIYIKILIWLMNLFRNVIAKLKILDNNRVKEMLIILVSKNLNSLLHPENHLEVLMVLVWRKTLINRVKVKLQNQV
jgi:hypothetical protein